MFGAGLGVKPRVTTVSGWFGQAHLPGWKSREREGEAVESINAPRRKRRSQLPEKGTVPLPNHRPPILQTPARHIAMDAAKSLTA